MWLNIDIPTKDCALHPAQCQWVKGMKETPLKGIGDLKDHGGWMEFQTSGQAMNFHDKHHPYFKFHECSFCKRLIEKR